MDTIGCSCLSTALMSFHDLTFLHLRIEVYRCWEKDCRYCPFDRSEQTFQSRTTVATFRFTACCPRLDRKCTKHWWNHLAISIGKHRFVFFVFFVLSWFCIVFSFGFCTMEGRSLAFLWLEVSGNLATVFIVSSRSSPCHVTWDLCFCFHRAIKHCGPVGRVRRVKGERHQLVSEF